MEKKLIKYNIGLDIGTNSVGWVVTDEEDNILKLNSKRHMWGVRLFDEANSAAERRMFRSNARRKARRKFRIQLLQEIFKGHIPEDFFDSLELSKIHKNDQILIKSSGKKVYRLKKYNLFNEENFNDKNLYNKYKTIYHLRSTLVNKYEQEDLKLVYLAIHHIIKYRGNFLYQGDFNTASTNEIMDNLKNIISFITNNEVEVDMIDFNNVFAILQDESLFRKQKIEKLMDFFNVDNDIKKKINIMFRLICGFKDDISKLFEISDKKNLSLMDEYDEGEIEALLGEQYEFFCDIKSINSWYLLSNTLKGKKYISDAFILKYDKYAQDLQLLKNWYKKILPSRYNSMFNDLTQKGYATYASKKNILKDTEVKCTLDELYSIIKNDIKKAEQTSESKKILEYIDNYDFLIKLNSVENGAIPYQLHREELKKILDNQGKYYPFLQENAEKIVKILEFRIPYYVGPLHNDENQPNNWSVRYEGMEHEKVLPWNFDKVIDVEKTANIFIRRMTNKCTYLPNEDVIPKNSLLYSEFCLLNELNGVRYNGKKLSKEEKEAVINELFKTTKTITVKKLKTFLKIKNNTEISSITGLQKEDGFASSLTSYIDFTSILGEVNEQNYDMIEEIIEWITIFEDKDILRKKIENVYGSMISQDKVDKIVKLKYSGWSRLSKKLLTGIIYENDCLEKLSIIDILRRTDQNFMQIISDKDYGFNAIINSYQYELESKKINSKFYQDNIATLQSSPAIKRGIWQALKIVDEIVHIMGNEPENIYIEVARSDEESKRTESRKTKLQKAYTNFCKEYESEINRELKDKLYDKNIDITDRLYLYCTQNGKCMYTGKTLVIDDLETYQIDHIIPQSKIKDDSLDNRVLVYAVENQRKTDGFISDEIVSIQSANWKKLLDTGLISPKKYWNLVNNKETDKRIEGFIQRQLVETRQITKKVVHLLENVYENTKVFSLKACLAHDFREKYNILKIRELNHYHHAHDAYINSVIGNYIISRYPKMLKEFIYSEYLQDFRTQTNNNQENKKKSKEYGFIISNIENEYTDSSTGEIIDSNQRVERINKALKQLDIKDIFITKKLEEKTGAFYNQTINSAKKSLKLATPIKIKEGLDCEKYGAYTGEVDAYSSIIKYSKRGKIEYKIQGVPIKETQYIKTQEQLREYFKVAVDSSAEILHNKILSNQLIYKDGKPYYIVSDGEIKICRQLWISKVEQNILYVALSEKNKVSKETYELVESFFEEKIINSINDYKQELKNLALDYSYDLLAKKINELYFEEIGLNLKKLRTNYIKLSIQDKQKTLMLLLDIVSGKTANLNLIGGKTGQGRICNKTMNSKWLSNVTFVFQSVTGMYEKKVTLDELANNNSK